MSNRSSSSTATPRKPLSEMTPDEIHAWIRVTRTALQKKMQRERAYLTRRAQRGLSTATDEAYEQDQLLEADLLVMLLKFRLKGHQKAALACQRLPDGVQYFARQNTKQRTCTPWTVPY